MACRWLEIVFNLKVEKAEIKKTWEVKTLIEIGKRKAYGKRGYMINNW